MPSPMAASQDVASASPAVNIVRLVVDGARTPLYFSPRRRTRPEALATMPPMPAQRPSGDIDGAAHAD